VTSPYGWRVHPITGVETFHYGEDTVGDGNFAPVTGQVIFAGYYGGLGYLVTIREDATTIWLVGHHASLAVAAGDWVIEDVTFTGPTGATGAATGIHAHTERRLSRLDSPQAGTATNPRDYYTTPIPIEEFSMTDRIYIKSPEGSGTIRYALISPSEIAGGVRVTETHAEALAFSILVKQGSAPPYVCKTLGEWDSCIALGKSLHADWVALNSVVVGDVTVEADPAVVGRLDTLIEVAKANPEDSATAFFVTQKLPGN